VTSVSGRDRPQRPAHPTLTQALMEAAHDVEGQAIHI